MRVQNSDRWLWPLAESGRLRRHPRSFLETSVAADVAMRWPRLALLLPLLLLLLMGSAWPAPPRPQATPPPEVLPSLAVAPVAGCAFGRRRDQRGVCRPSWNW